MKLAFIVVSNPMTEPGGNRFQWLLRFGGAKASKGASPSSVAAASSSSASWSLLTDSVADVIEPS